MIGIIYKYTSPSNKMYIGQTVNEHLRYLSHKHMKDDTLFHKAIKKYGFNNFVYEIIVTVEKDDYKALKKRLDWFERYYIKKYNSFGKNGYNLTAGGGGSLGVKHTEEFKQKTSKRMKQNNPMKNPEIAKQSGMSKSGKPLAFETKKKISEKLKGRVFSQETKEKMSISSHNRQRNEKGQFIKITNG